MRLATLSCLHKPPHAQGTACQRGPPPNSRKFGRVESPPHVVAGMPRRECTGQLPSAPLKPLGSIVGGGPKAVRRLVLAAPPASPTSVRGVHLEVFGRP